MRNSNTVSTNDLAKAYSVAAQLVAEYGADYVPVFERMEVEMEQSRRLEDAVLRAQRTVDSLARQNKKKERR